VKEARKAAFSAASSSIIDSGTIDTTFLSRSLPTGLKTEETLSEDILSEKGDDMEISKFSFRKRCKPCAYPACLPKKDTSMEYLGTTNRVYRKSIPLMVDPDPSCRHVPLLISEMVKSQVFKRS
jgi:hypothetical protein